MVRLKWENKTGLFKISRRLFRKAHFPITPSCHVYKGGYTLVHFCFYCLPYDKAFYHYHQNGVTFRFGGVVVIVDGDPSSIMRSLFHRLKIPFEIISNIPDSLLAMAFKR